ncbi:MAG: ABC transporter permease [Dermatophilaceae bacterium]
MIPYIIRRLFSGLVLLLVMSFVTFALFFSGPDPVKYTCGKNCTPQILENNRKGLGYDKPFAVQWVDFAKGIVLGREFPDDPALKAAAPNLIARCDAPCLGYSPLSSANVSTVLMKKAPVSASLALGAFIMWMVVGVTAGVIAALRKGTLLDRGLVGTTLIFYAFPTFFNGLFIYNYFALKWQLVPVPAYTPPTESFALWLQGLFLPCLTLALFYIAGYVRLTRAFVLESLSEDYLRTAKAKGLAPRKILLKHTMRAALTPLATIAGLDLGGLLGGAIITEQVFNYDGLGKLAVQSATTYDLPITVGIVVLLASFIIVANIVVDVLYAFIDPRVKYA